MGRSNLRLLMFSVAIAALLSLLSFEVQAARKKTKPAVKNKANVSATAKSPTSPSQAQIKIKKRGPASLSIPPGVPTELPEKVLLIPADDLATN